MQVDESALNNEETGYNATIYSNDNSDDMARRYKFFIRQCYLTAPIAVAST